MVRPFTLGSDELKSNCSPTLTVIFVLLSPIELGAFLTVIVKELLIPSALVTVITAVPALLATTFYPEYRRKQHCHLSLCIQKENILNHFLQSLLGYTAHLHPSFVFVQQFAELVPQAVLR